MGSPSASGSPFVALGWGGSFTPLMTFRRGAVFGFPPLPFSLGVVPESCDGVSMGSMTPSSSFAFILNGVRWVMVNGEMGLGGDWISGCDLTPARKPTPAVALGSIDL